MKQDSIGDRMKANYENRYRLSLTRRTPVIIRLDGRAFHTLTRGFTKPFDGAFSHSMDTVATALCVEIQGAKCAYVQSDEISILLTDFDTLTTEAWFDYNIQKMTSITSGIASAAMTEYIGKRAVFDSRTFNIPVEEVCNYFIWRQLDWIRNSVQMLAQAHFSQKQLHKKNQWDMHDMLHGIGINWADLPERYKNGHFLYKNESWVPDDSVIFKQNREVIEKLLAV